MATTSIDPRLIQPTGGVSPVYDQLANLERLINQTGGNTVIGAGTITGGTGGMIAAGTITGGQIVAGTITADLIAALAINAGHIQAGAITSTHIAANTITAADIAAGTITATEIAASTIQAANIAAHAITANEIAASTITSNEIAANTITASDIAAGTITGDRIAAGTITGTLIASATITGSNLVAATVTADKLSVSTLSAITANLGTITAGTITGATFQSSASNPRVYMDSTGVGAVDSGGTTTFKLDASTGKLTTLSGVGGGNLLRNSSFENTSNFKAGYTEVGGTAAVNTSNAKHGAQSFAWTRTGSTGNGGIDMDFSGGYEIPINPNLSYVFSAWIKAATTARDYRFTYMWKNAAGTTVSTETGTSYTGENNTEFKRAVETRTPPAGLGVTKLQARFEWLNVPVGETHYIDALQVEEGSFATAYAPKPDEILPGTVTGNSGGAGTGSIAPGTIIGTDLVADTITATQIAASAITATELAALSVAAGNIQAGAITTVKLDVGAVTADKMNVAVLSAITADMGSVSAGTITGVTIQTATSGQRVVLDATGLTAYGSDGITASVVLPTAGDALFRGALDAEGGLTFNVPTTAPPPGSRKAAWLDASESEVASVFGVTNTYPGSTNQALIASATGPMSYTTLVKAHANLKHYWKLNGATSPSLDSVASSPKNLTAYTTGTSSAASASGLIAGADQAVQSNAEGRGWFYGAPAAAENVTTGWSVEYWIRMGSKPVGDVRLVARSTTNDYTGTEYWKSTYKGATGKIEVSIRIGAAAKIQTTATTLATNTTYHVVHTYDGANIKTYLNGTADGAATAQTGSIDAQGTGYYLAGIIQGIEFDGARNVGTAVDSNLKSASFSNWSGLTNLASSNNVYATCTYDGTEAVGLFSYSPILDATNFGFAIPTGATIRGIQVNIERKCSKASSTYDLTVMLLKGGSPVGTNKAYGSLWSTTEAVISYGNAGGTHTDLWGSTWSVADINDTNFGLRFEAIVDGGPGANTISIDNIQIIVYYSTAVIVDEVAVYNAALSTTVISDHYQTGVTGISTSAATYERKIIRSDGTSDFMDNQLVSALPSTPYDGQVIAYQNTAMATAGVEWLFRYRAASSSSFKWEWIGGPPLFVEVDTFETATSTVYTANQPTTAGPSVTVPLAGDWIVAHGAHTHSQNAAGATLYMSYSIGASAAVDGDGAYLVTNSSGLWGPVHRENLRTGMAANTALVAKYRSSAGAADWERRWIRILPVRVG